MVIMMMIITRMYKCSLGKSEESVDKINTIVRDVTLPRERRKATICPEALDFLLAALGAQDGRRGLLVGHLAVGDLLQHVKTLHHATNTDIPSIHPLTGAQRDEELAAIGVGATGAIANHPSDRVAKICHKALILDTAITNSSITAITIALDDISRLEPASLHDAVDWAALVVQLGKLRSTQFTRTQQAEVLAGQGYSLLE